MSQPRVDADARIRRRWLAGIALFAAAWFLLLGPLANALFGLPGAAPDKDAQANRLIYEELVKLVLVLGVAGLASWVGVRTLTTRTFPPAGMRVPVRMSVNRGPGALLPGIALILVALATLGFRIASLRITLELAALLRRVG
ncbi:MAG: hypothetical protein OEW72_09780 [Gammaproteobacteria bacterium]|nr:hypothetical protein [Gammaproteobacteria bacterium]